MASLKAAGMVFLVQSLLLLIHLLANAIAAGGPMVAALLPGPSEVRRRLAGVAILALIVGLVAGGLSSLVVLAGGWPEYASAAGRLPSKAYLMLGSEWAFTAVLMVAYYLSWERLGRRRWLHGAIGVVAATNLLYHFPTMMVVLRLLAEQPDRASELVVTRPVFLDVLWTPLPIGLTLHFWGLATVGSGVAVMLLGEQSDGPSRRVGAGIGLAGALGLMLSGVWCVLHLPASQARALLSWGTLSGWCFWAGVGSGVALVAVLASNAAGAGRRPWNAAALAVLSAAMMVAAARSL